ncbi:hypothetical protein [Frisingicoccus sp.]|uniref:hypothetical protein n=1 Tax=Frisingicoccus sp. TaxID=1918627 RepID=UPI002E9BDEEF|nr:hypothetical protein [Frisingicoccus sp.]
MMGYGLMNGKLQDVFDGDTAGLEPAAVFLLNAEGVIQKIDEIPDLSEGEGLLMYAGDFYIDPLEIQIDFLKADHAKMWLEALVLRHIERVRHIGDDLWVVAQMREVEV